jgi:hypothetical protein
MEAGTLAGGWTAARAHVGVRSGALAAVPLAAITLVGAVLRLWAFDRVPSNPF